MKKKEEKRKMEYVSEEGDMVDGIKGEKRRERKKNNKKDKGGFRRR